MGIIGARKSRLAVFALACGIVVALANDRAEQRQKAPPTPRTSTSQPPAVLPRGPAFTFDTQTGGVNEALRTLVALRLQPSDTPEEESRKAADTAKAEATLRRDHAAGAKIIVDNLERLAADDLPSHATLMSLLSLVAEDETAIRYYQRVAMTGPPRAVEPRPKPGRAKSPPDRPGTERAGAEDPHVLIRYMAMSGLFTAARKGDQRAINAIRDTLNSPHREVKATAVRYYYALSKSRLRAKAEMRERLAPRDQYLLNLY
jgi:hypothetical protein